MTIGLKINFPTMFLFHRSYKYNLYKPNINSNVFLSLELRNESKLFL